MTPTEAVGAMRLMLIARTCTKFGLEPVDIPSEFARKRGHWNGRPLELRTRIYSGRGVLSRLHVAWIESDDDAAATLTVIGLPRTTSGRPSLAADMVAFGGAFGTAILDLVPADGTTLDPEPRERLCAARARLAAADVGRRRGDSSAGATPMFSPNVTWVTTLDSGRETELCSTFAVYVDAFIHSLEAPSATAPAKASAGQSRFLSQLASVKKQTKALSKLFGGPWVAQYFDDCFLDTRAVD